VFCCSFKAQAWLFWPFACARETFARAVLSEVGRSIVHRAVSRSYVPVSGLTSPAISAAKPFHTDRLAGSGPGARLVGTVSCVRRLLDEIGVPNNEDGKDDQHREGERSATKISRPKGRPFHGN